MFGMWGCSPHNAAMACSGSVLVFKRVCLLAGLLSVAALPADDSGEMDGSSEAGMWSWGLLGGLGYFNFRDSLFLDIDPDPPGNLSDDWAEFYIKPWIKFSHTDGNNQWFGMASWAYVRTDDQASEISGGAADSADLDDLYLGWRRTLGEQTVLELAGGRYPYQIARGFMISDGYADGGSRGGMWSNARKAWAPGGRLRLEHAGHNAELFYIDRDERPESDSETRLAGLNYEWSSAGERLELGVSLFGTEANELKPQLDGARMYNLRLYSQPGRGWRLDGEWVRQDNGAVLDANAWYLQGSYQWQDSAWRPTLYYRYAYFQGDDPDTLANENYEPMFPAFYDWGSWWQGEIAGEYFLSNSNIKTQLLRLHTDPRDTIGTGILFFDYTLDQPRSFADGVVSDDLAWEVNWYMDWQFSKSFTASFVLARNQPGKALEEAYERTKDFKYAMVYLTLDY